jgi:Na+/proline symporter
MRMRTRPALTALKRFILARSLAASWMKAISFLGMPAAMSRERASS